MFNSELGIFMDTKCRSTWKQLTLLLVIGTTFCVTFTEIVDADTKNSGFEGYATK